MYMKRAIRRRMKEPIQMTTVKIIVTRMTARTTEPPMYLETSVVKLNALPKEYRVSPLMTWRGASASKSRFQPGSRPSV
jgi:hypothetical protein